MTSYNMVRMYTAFFCFFPIAGYSFFWNHLFGEVKINDNENSKYFDYRMKLFRCRVLRWTVNRFCKRMAVFTDLDQSTRNSEMGYGHMWVRDHWKYFYRKLCKSNITRYSEADMPEGETASLFHEQNLRRFEQNE